MTNIALFYRNGGDVQVTPGLRAQRAFNFTIAPAIS